MNKVFVPHGKGRFTKQNGEFFDGEWSNGKLITKKNE